MFGINGQQLWTSLNSEQCTVHWWFSAWAADGVLCCCGIRRKDAAQRGKQLKPLKLLLCFCHWFHEVATFMYIIVYSWSKKIKHTHNIIIIYDFVANLFWLFAANSRPNSQPGSWLFGDCLVSFSYLTLSDCERFHSHNNFNANSICFANTLPSVFWPLRLLSSCFQPVNNVFPHNLHGRQRSKDWNRCHMQWRKCVSQMRAIEGGVTAPQKQKVFHFVCPM
jgi:hypothetical protein